MSDTNLKDIETYHPSGPGGDTLDHVVCLNAEVWHDVGAELARLTAERDAARAEVARLRAACRAAQQALYTSGVAEIHPKTMRELRAALAPREEGKQ